MITPTSGLQRPVIHTSAGKGRLLFPRRHPGSKPRWGRVRSWELGFSKKRGGGVAQGRVVRPSREQRRGGVVRGGRVNN